jgi:nucleotide sugar dehydrogenase
MNISIIGCGKLGICYASCFAQVGFNVYIYDINTKILDDIRDDKYNYNEPQLNDMISKYKSNFILCYDLKKAIDNSKLLFTFIQTPSLNDGSFNLNFIDGFVDDCISFGKVEDKKIIIINSTVTPEFCNYLLNKIQNYNYDICYNPSFIAQGTIISNIINPEFIIIGADNDIHEEIIEIHRKVIQNPDVSYNKMKLYEAEVNKIANNCFKTIKISYINLIGDLLKSKGYNPDIVLASMATDSYVGFRNMNYGFGYGGPCLPRDNKAFHNYIYNKINNPNINFDICKINDKNNHNHLLFQFDELKDSKEPIEFHYITYKDSSDIIEESQKLKLASLLANNGNTVIIYERPFMINRLKEIYKDLFTYIEI